MMTFIHHIMQHGVA